MIRPNFEKFEINKKGLLTEETRQRSPLPLDAIVPTDSSPLAMHDQ